MMFALPLSAQLLLAVFQIMAAAKSPATAFTVAPISPASRGRPPHSYQVGNGRRVRYLEPTSGSGPFSDVSSNRFHGRASALVRTFSQNSESEVNTHSKRKEGRKTKGSTRERIRSKVKKLAKSFVSQPIVASVASATPAPEAIAEVIKDATVGAVDMAVDEVITSALQDRRIHRGRAFGADTRSIEESAAMEGEAAVAVDAIALAKTTAADAFAAAESAVADAETALAGARVALIEAKMEAAEAIAAAEEAAAAASACAQKATALATSAASATAEIGVRADAATGAAPEIPVAADAEAMVAPSEVSKVDVSALTYEDVGYHLSEMAPPFIGEDQCLVPGEAVVRVEKAPDNSRRIFAGIDIMASVDDVWNALTDYENLQNVVPNLVVNEVLELYESDADAPSNTYDESKPDEEQCESISKHMRGAKLRQVGGAKVVGINFSARTTLEVREWPEGMPDFAHYSDEVYEGKSRAKRAREGKGLKLERYRFPRPFALSSLPTRDISMQSVEKDDGEFRLYQGVWRMQPLPGCTPPGEHAMRLTYAVEISPRPYLPVALVEGRIAQDLCNNLRAIRDHVTPVPVPA